VVAERTVELLLADERVEVVVAPALSFLDLAWVRLGVDPVALGVRVVDGHRFEAEAAGERGPLLVAQCDSVHVLSDVKLALADAVDRAADLGGGLARLGAAEDGTDVPGAGWVGDDLEVTVVQRLGLPDETVTVVHWHELDRVDADHLTSLWIPELAAPVAGAVQRFAELVATLRAECPWDREQTHHSLRRHLLEEAYEVLEALDHLPPDDVPDDVPVADERLDEAYLHLEEELGDLLFQILFHATLAAEAGRFTLADVATTVTDKLRARHPHVFGGGRAGTADEVAATWEQAKKAEKGRDSVFDGIPDALPALLFALKVQKKAATLDLGDAAPTVPTLEEALAALRPASGGGVPGELAIGDLLLAVVAEARAVGVDPENALRARATAWRDQARTAEP
jgi:tetrapyrrole methylase family protein/MazG family protein